MNHSQPDQIYSMSFTSGTLLWRESLTVAGLYRTLDDWDAVRAQVRRDNLLQMRTLNASKRIFSEISSRLRQLSAEQLNLLLDGSPQEQTYLLWLAFCRRYRFVYDFAVDVVREKLIRRDFRLTPEDYTAYFNTQAEWRPEMERVAQITIRKQRQTVFKTMREAGLLSAGDEIIPAALSDRLVRAITNMEPADLTVFPLSDREIRDWTR